MRIFDPHIHMSSRTTDDYERMAAAGVRALVEPAFWLGQPRTNVGSFTDYFDSLIGWERFRASRFGIRHHCAIALNPKEANDPCCHGVLDVLPRYLAKDGVVAVGEVGYDSMTAEEDEAFAAQLELAVEHGLPVLVHTPHRDKQRGTRRALDVVKESGIPLGRVLIDHLNEVTVELVAGTGCWASANGRELGGRLGPQRSAAHGADRGGDAVRRVHGGRRGPGTFPLFRYWGPGAGIESSEWICRAARHIMSRYEPDLTLVYVPHLDYDLQRYGPSGPRAVSAAVRPDAVLRPLLDAARTRGAGSAPRYSGSRRCSASRARRHTASTIPVREILSS
jgi:predicted metal-dependent TIM-barrel fold hydrolase